MNTKDTRNFLHQMRWRNQLNRCNREKQMQQEIMELKKENLMLKRQVSDLSEWMRVFGHSVEKANAEVRYMKEHFIPVND